MRHLQSSLQLFRLRGNGSPGGFCDAYRLVERQTTAQKTSSKRAIVPRRCLPVRTTRWAGASGAWCPRCYGKFTETVHRQQACGGHETGIAHRAARRRGRAELVAGDGLSGCGHGGVGELVAARLMMPAMRAGVKARVTHGVLRTGRGVPEYARDELARAQAQRLALLVAMAGVVEAHAALSQIQYPVIGQRSAPDVTRQIQRNPTAMGVGRRDLDVPVFAVLLCDRAAPVLRVLLRWQPHALRIQRVLELRQQLAAEQ